MNFKKATDILFSSVGHAELATALQVSVASIRQARLTEGAKALRGAPRGWQQEVRALAKQRAHALLDLAEKLEENDTLALGIKPPQKPAVEGRKSDGETRAARRR